VLDSLILILTSLNLESVSDLISDTFTLLAGFVAIGIPLSMQVVEKAAQRYKSEYLIKHLSSWYWFSPTVLVSGSFIYIVLALLAKYLISIQCSQCSSGLYIYIWILILYFLSLLLVIGMWYRHLLTTLQKRPEDLLNDLS
jgi:hypothetical protein